MHRLTFYPRQRRVLLLVLYKYTFFRGSSSRDSGPKKGSGMVSREREPWVRFCSNCPNCMDSCYDMDTVGKVAQVVLGLW
jgi:hypothetical protein